MFEYMYHIVHRLSKLFSKDKRIKNSSSKDSTPPRIPTRSGPKGCRNPDVFPALRQTPVPRKVPRSCTSIRCPSQISVKRFGSEDNISFSRNRTFNGCLENRVPEPFGCNFEVDNAVKNDNSNFPELSAYKSSNTSLDYFCMAGDRLQEPVKPYERAKKQFNLSTQYPNIDVPSCTGPDGCQNPDVLRSLKQTPVPRKFPRSCPSIRCPSQNTFDPKSGFPPKPNSASRKIPISNLNRYSIRMMGDNSKLPPQRLRGCFTLASPPMHLSGDLEASEEPSDIPEFKSSDISNWIAYRKDTSARFDRTFKALSKKKFTIGNLLDSASHVQWLQLAGIMADQDATMFKQFAGGKIVLTCGEYKFLISKMCTIHDLDYWDVLRKMATFQDEYQNEIEGLLKHRSRKSEQGN